MEEEEVIDPCGQPWEDLVSSACMSEQCSLKTGDEHERAHRYFVYPSMALWSEFVTIWEASTLIHEIRWCTARVYFGFFLFSFFFSSFFFILFVFDAPLGLINENVRFSGLTHQNHDPNVGSQQSETIIIDDAKMLQSTTRKSLVIWNRRTPNRKKAPPPPPKSM